LITSLHNHTTWGDGKASPAEMMTAAATQGVDELGISDHLVLRPDREIPSWSLRPDQLDAYVSDLVRLRSEEGPAVRIGLEVDWFPAHPERIRDTLHGLPLDYVIGSVHEIDGFVVDVADAWQDLRLDQQNEIHREYWHRIATLAGSGLFDIVAHLDLTKKHGYRPSIDLTREISAALDAIAAADLAVELNTSGWHFPAADAYPSEPLVTACRERCIPMLLSADAHEPAHVRRDFERGAARLRKAGYENLVRFEDRRRISAPLCPD